MYGHGLLDFNCLFISGKLYVFTEELLGVVQNNVGEMSWDKEADTCSSVAPCTLVREYQWQQKRCQGFACVITDAQHGVSSFLPLTT